MGRAVISPGAPSAGGGGASEALRWLLVASSSSAGDNSAAELAFDKSVTIPANTLSAGSLLRIRAHGICTDNSGFTNVQVRLRLGGIAGVLLADTGSAWNPNAGDGWILKSEMSVRSTSEGFNFGEFPGQAFALFDVHGAKVIDTTSDADLVATVQFGAANVGQGARLDVLEVFVNDSNALIS